MMVNETPHSRGGKHLAFLIGSDPRSLEPIFVPLAQVGHMLLLGRRTAVERHVWSMLLQLTAGNTPEDLRVTFLQGYTETALLFQDLPHTVEASQVPGLLEQQERGQRRPFILLIAEDLDATLQLPSSLEYLEGVLREGRKRAVGVTATATSPYLPESILATMPTQVLLPKTEELVLEPWQTQLLDVSPEPEATPGRAFLLLDGKSRWFSPISLTKGLGAEPWKGERYCS